MIQRQGSLARVADLRYFLNTLKDLATLGILAL